MTFYLYGDTIIMVMKLNKDKELAVFHCPRWEELPEMDLYMDQVVTLLNGYLKPFCVPEQGKPITSTMINNYVKHGIVSAPKKKRYTRQHLAYLIVVFILKTVFTLDEISNLLRAQMGEYPQDQAYNYFCVELESSLRCIYAHRHVRHIPSDNEGSVLVDLIRSTIQGVAYSVYVRDILKDVSEKE